MKALSFEDERRIGSRFRCDVVARRSDRICKGGVGGQRRVVSFEAAGGGGRVQPAFFRRRLGSGGAAVVSPVERRQLAES